MNKMSSVPDEYLCPITQLVMVDPVLGSDGRTYERSAITEWLRTHNTSPITREAMTAASLKPNYALRSLIERHRAAPPVRVVATQPPSQIETDHYYALEVFQQETVGYNPAVKAPVPPPTAPPVPTKPQKRLTVFCAIVVVIIILAIIIHFL